MDSDDHVPSPDPVVRDARRWTELGWGDPSAMLALMSVTRTHKQIVDRCHAALDHLSLSITDSSALIFLGLTPGHLQPIGKIAERLLITPARCSYVIDRLEKQGLVERRSHQRDRRTILVALTPAGHDALQQVREGLANAGYGFGDLPAAALKEVVSALSTVRAALSDTDDIQFEDSGEGSAD